MKIWLGALRGCSRFAFAIAVVAAAAGVARAQAPSRDTLLDAFDELRSHAKKIYDPKAFITVRMPRGGDHIPVDVYTGNPRDALDRFKGITIKDKTATTNTKLMFKVWAVPLQDGKLTNKKVHLGRYPWQPKEQMAIFFETAIDSQVGFYQEFDKAAGETEARVVRVLPDPNPAKFPEARKTVKGGVPFRFPVDIELDDNNLDEVMVIVVVAAGSDPDLPPKDPNYNPNKPGVHHAVFGKKYIEKLDKKAKEARSLARFRATSSSDPGVPDKEVDPDSDVETTGNPDRVAIICYGPDEFGMLRIRIHKKK